MKAGELYVEQVFIGALVIATAALSFLPEIVSLLNGSQGLGGLATGSLALGIAFLFGVPFDRFADTLTERLDRHGRLRSALRRAEGRVLLPRGDRRRLNDDFFPEDKLRVMAFREAPAVVAWIDYHRSRIRLTRALFVCGPGLTLAGTVGSGRMISHAALDIAVIVTAAICGAYIVWFLMPYDDELPRTDSLELRKYAKKWRWTEGCDKPVRAFRKAKAAEEYKIASDAEIWRDEWRGLAMPVALLAAALLWSVHLAYHGGGGLPLAVAVTGVLLVPLFAWSWWCISFTFRSYLFDVNRYARKPGSP